MPITVTWLIAALVVIAFIVVAALLLTGQDKGSRQDGGLSLNTPPGSVVTVRKVGEITSVLIRENIRDHWEGADSIPLPLPSTDVTRREEPALYAEYMSPDTPATRKYEIIDEVYALGYTLPYITGLEEQRQKELREAAEGGDPDARVVHARTPINLTPKAGTAGTLTGGTEGTAPIDNLQTQ